MSKCEQKRSKFLFRSVDWAHPAGAGPGSRLRPKPLRVSAFGDDPLRMRRTAVFCVPFIITGSARLNGTMSSGYCDGAIE